MAPSKEIPGWLRGAIVIGVAGCLVALELSRSLRKRKREPELVRGIRNLAIAAGAGAVMQLIERPVAMRLAGYVQRNELGMVHRLAKSNATRVLLSVILLDYGLYAWHVLTHKVPWLWRFHLVHHVDLDLDASTAVRFHFGEMLLSIPWRLAQIRVIGASPLALSVWQTFLFTSILFHHSNVELPERMERRLSWIIMTPRLHGIHHQARRESTNSNWSSGLTIWDFLHGTYRWHQDAGTIGVPAYQDPAEVTLPRCLVIPFEHQRDTWAQIPGMPHTAIAPPQLDPLPAVQP
jgi:sterol desaturase/sphingolipid hydroxylase (fatty acid hydroxylase superfamily)